MNILVLAIQKQEVEEYAHEESEVWLVSVILISCPDLKSKTLSLESEIKYLPVIHNWVSNLSNYRKKSSRIPQLLLFPDKSKNYQKVEQQWETSKNGLEKMRNFYEREEYH